MSPQLGAQLSIHRGSTGKGILNFVLAGIFVLLGLMTLMLPGGILFGVIPFGIAIFLVLLTLRNITYSSITLYENGVVVQRGQRSEQWTFDQIDGLRIVPYKNPGAAPDIGFVGSMLLERFMHYATRAPRSYDFYVDGRKVLSVRAYHDRWHELGGALVEKMHAQLVQRLSAKLADGETVIFDRLHDGSFLAEMLHLIVMIPRYVKLELSGEGLRLKDGPVMAWHDVRLRAAQETGDLIVLLDVTGKTSLTIKRFQSINALVAETLIQKQIGA